MMTIQKGDKVVAEFPEGDKIILTVKGISLDAYYFEEKHLADWWYKTLCTKIS